MCVTIKLFDFFCFCFWGLFFFAELIKAQSWLEAADLEVHIPQNWITTWLIPLEYSYWKHLCSVPLHSLVSSWSDTLKKSVSVCVCVSQFKDVVRGQSQGSVWPWPFLPRFCLTDSNSHVFLRGCWRIAADAFEGDGWVIFVLVFCESLNSPLYRFMPHCTSN